MWNTREVVAGYTISRLNEIFYHRLFKRPYCLIFRQHSEDTEIYGDPWSKKNTSEKYLVWDSMMGGTQLFISFLEDENTQRLKEW